MNSPSFGINVTIAIVFAVITCIFAGFIIGYFSIPIGIILGIIYMVQIAVEIPENTVAVVSYFSRRTEIEVKEGWYFPIPFVEKIDNQVTLEDSTIKIGETKPFNFPARNSADENDKGMIKMEAKATIVFKPEEGKIRLNFNTDKKVLEKRLVDSVLESLRVLGSKKTYTDLTQNLDTTKEWFIDQMATMPPAQNVQEILEKYGFELVSVNLTKVATDDPSLVSQLAESAKEEAQAKAALIEAQTIANAAQKLKDGGINPDLADEMAGAIARIPKYEVLRISGNASNKININRDQRGEK